MDKNTLLGLLLMAGCIFGFMYINKPSEEDLAARRAEQERAAAAADDSNAAISVTDTLGVADLSQLAAVVRTIGVADGNGRYTLDNGSVAVSADSTAVEGIVRTGSADVTIADLATLGSALTPETRSAAVKAVRKVSSKSHSRAVAA